MKPGHITFASDPKTFAALYLSEPRDRMNGLNKPLPMLIRAANAAPRAIAAAPGSKPTLIADVSALLLARRCNLLGEIENAFKIQVPESLPLALIAIEDEWPSHDDGTIAIARAWLADGKTAVKVVDVVPPEDSTPARRRGHLRPAG